MTQAIQTTSGFLIIATKPQVIWIQPSWKIRAMNIFSKDQFHISYIQPWKTKFKKDTIPMHIQKLAVKGNKYFY